MCSWSRKCNYTKNTVHIEMFTLFYMHSVFWVSPSMLMVSLILALYYACNILEYGIIFNSLFLLFIYFGNLDVFLDTLILAIKAFWLISDLLTFAKFVESLKRSMVSRGRYFLIFQPKDMLNYCLNLNESQPI